MRKYLAPLEGLTEAMVEETTGWASINSGTPNLAGIAKTASAVIPTFEAIGFKTTVIPPAPASTVNRDGDIVPLTRGPVYHLAKNPAANRRILLAGHLDTVFPADHPFQKVARTKDGKLHGPGCADMKGGIVVMREALRCFAASPFADSIGFDILLNSDEETGSHASSPSHALFAKKADVGLVYEPALPDGTLAGARAGSGIYTFIVRGRSAHAGRSFNEGRNAIAGAARLITSIDALNGQRENTTLNLGTIKGGVASNVVPDLCLVELNVRGRSPEAMAWIDENVRGLIASTNFGPDIRVEIAGGIHRPVKTNQGGTLALFEAVKACGAELGLAISWAPTGGCCDGNNLAAAGLPTVDTLGVRGAFIHSADEYASIDSFVERAELSTLVMLGLAAGEIPWPTRV